MSGYSSILEAQNFDIYFKCDEASGTTITNYGTTSSADGSVDSGETTYQQSGPDTGGYGLQFTINDGLQAYTAAAEALVTSQADWFIAFWWKWDSGQLTDGNNHKFLQIDTSDGAAGEFSFYIRKMSDDTNYRIRGSVDGGGNSADIDFTTATGLGVDDTDWHHFIIHQNFDGSKTDFYLYVDGTIVNSGNPVSYNLGPLDGTQTVNSRILFGNQTPGSSSWGSAGTLAHVVIDGNAPSAGIITILNTLTVDDPVWYAVPKQRVSEGDSVSLNLTSYVYDANDDVADLTISEVGSNLATLGLSLASKTISGTIADLATQTVTVTLRVTNTSALTADQTVTFEVTATSYDSMSWKFLVDWENDGDYTDGIDDITAYVQSARWRLGFRKAYQLMSDEIDMEMTVVNTDKRFTPENSSSPYYPYIKPHRRMRIVVTADGDDIVMWTGWIEFPQINWKPEGSYSGKTVAKIRGSGPKRLLQEKTVNLSYQQNITGDTAIEAVLRQAGSFAPVIKGVWSLGTVGYSELGVTTYLGSVSDFASLDAGVVSLDAYGDDTTINAYDAINEVTSAERGRFYIERDGSAVWWNRYHLLEKDTDEVTIQSDTGNYKPIALDYQYGQSIVNIVRTKVNQRRSESSETLWTLQEPVAVPPGEKRVLSARLRKSTGQFAGSDHLSSSYTFSQGTADVDVLEQGGKAQITLDNTGGATEAICDSFVLSGQPTTKQDEMEVESRDATSVGDYGPIEMSIDLGPIANYDDALSVANFELSRRKNARGEVPTIEYNRKDTDITRVHQVEWRIGKRINVTFSEMDHNNSYYIIGEEHNWDKLVHKTRYNLEPAGTAVYWTLGVPGKTELGLTSTLAY